MRHLIFTEDRTQAICLLGTCGAGKSRSLNILKKNPALTHRTPIVNFESYTWKCPTLETNHLRIWDCSGFTEVQKLTGMQIKRSKGVLAFYNSYFRESFSDLTTWI